MKKHCIFVIGFWLLLTLSKNADGRPGALNGNFDSSNGPQSVPVSRLNGNLEIPDSHIRALGDFLTPDRTLSLPPEGVEGSIDPAGYRIVSGPEEALQFIKDDNDSSLRAEGDEKWDSRFNLRGFNGPVYAFAWDGSNLYVGGSFTAVNEVLVNNIAKWDGSNWSTLGTGVNNIVYALKWDGTNLYAGGGFSTAGGAAASRIAKWNGSNWSALGSGVNSTVNAIAWDGVNLFAGGNFTTAGGSPASRIAKWDGSAWSPLGAGVGSTVNTIISAGAELYVGGSFTTAGGSPAARIAKWDGAAWSPLGAGVNSTVISLVSVGTSLYVGGGFTTAGGSPAARIAKWDGSTWSPLGSGVNSTVYSLASIGPDLYVGGMFSTAGGSPAACIARWDGSTWSPIGSGTSSAVRAMAWDGSNLFAGGIFASAGGTIVNYIARWDGSAWSVMGRAGMGMNGSVNALAWDNSSLYAGGMFNAAGETAANYIAKWNGTAWSALGTGMDGGVNALTWDGTNLYAGGNFWTAGASVVSSVAKWDGTTWSALGTGMNDSVYALAWAGGNLYAGGSFTTAGGSPAARIAKWDGSAWSPLGTGMNGIVSALTWDGANLYAGGNFTTAGGSPAAYIAKWDGSAWNPLSAGLNANVLALATDGFNLYAGGNFTTAGGTPAAFVAKWDGAAWSPLGTGMNGTVSALTWDGASLYAGGYFMVAGGSSATRIAKWDGSIWSVLGSGTNSSVYALAATGVDLYAGGNFAVAGGKYSSYIGRYTLYDCPAPMVPAIESAVDIDSCAYSGIRVTWPEDATDWNDGGLGVRTYSVLRSGLTIQSEIPYGTTQYTDTAAAPGTIYAYSVLYINGCGNSLATVSTSSSDLSNGPAVPNNPNPADDAVGTTMENLVLDWNDSANAMAYDLYFGTMSPPPIYQSDLTSSTFTVPGCLAGNTVYYWAVSAKNGCGTLFSPTWSFTTLNSGPPSAANPLPLNNAVNIGIENITLDWDDSAGASAYDLYFGTASPPYLYQSNLTASTFTIPGPLKGNQTYRWSVQAKSACGTTAGPVWSFTTVSTPACGAYTGRFPNGPSRCVAVQSNYAYFSSGATLIVADISIPANPIKVGELFLGDLIKGVTVSGNYAYLATYNGLRVINISTPTAPSLTGTSFVGDAVDVVVSGVYAYVATWGGLSVINISIPASPVVAGTLNLPGFYNAIALAGTVAYMAEWQGGLRIIDVANPSAPVQLGFYDTSQISYDVALSGSYAYLAQSGNMQIVDISNPASPVGVGSYTTYSSNSIQVGGTYAYVAGAGILRIIDISTPSTPIQVGSTNWSASTPDTQAIAVQGNSLYLADYANGMRIIDVSTPTAPTTIGTYDTAGKAYSVSAAGNFAYVADYNRGLRIFDVSNPAVPAQVGLFALPSSYDVTVTGNLVVVVGGYGLGIIDVSTPSSPAQVGVVYCGDARGVVVVGNLAYVAANFDGLRIIDISTPATPIEIGFIDTPGTATGVAVMGSHAYVADGASGLRIIDVTVPTAPVEVGSFNTAGTASAVAVSGAYAYVADGLVGGLRIMDISTPSSPTEVGSYSCYALDVVVTGTIVYIANDLNSGVVVDAAMSANPKAIGWFGSGGIGRGVAVSGDLVFRAADYAGMDISNSRSCDPHASVPVISTNNSAADLNTCAFSGNGVYWPKDPANWGDGNIGVRNYAVLRNGTTIQSSITYGTTNFVDATAANSTLYEYKVRYTNGVGYYAATTGSVATDRNTPEVTITGPTSNACPVSTVTLTTQPGQSSYQWYKDGSPITGANSPSYTVMASGTYAVSYQSVSGCTGTSSPHIVNLVACSFIPEVVDINAIPNGTTIDIIFADPGQMRYNIYVSNSPITTAFAVADPSQGRVHCNVAYTDLGDTIQISAFDLTSGITGPTSILYYMITADNGVVESSLGSGISDGGPYERTADANCL